MAFLPHGPWVKVQLSGGGGGNLPRPRRTSLLRHSSSFGSRHSFSFSVLFIDMQVSPLVRVHALPSNQQSCVLRCRFCICPTCRILLPGRGARRRHRPMILEADMDMAAGRRRGGERAGHLLSAAHFINMSPVFWDDDHDCPGAASSLA